MFDSLMNNVSIVICSCLNKPERLEYLNECISNIKKLLGENVDILIGFDKHGTEIEGAKCYTHNKGMGHGFNWGIQNAKNEYILQIEDDWIIEIGGGNERFLPNLDALHYHISNRIKILEKYDGIFKFTHLGDDHYKSGKVELNFEDYKFLEWNKPEEYKINTWDIFRYSNQPHLKRKNLHEEIGWYKEEVPPHEVEEDMCRKLQLSDKRVFSCPFFTFIHIGTESSRFK